jgi:hypothetical protein
VLLALVAGCCFVLRNALTTVPRVVVSVSVVDVRATVVRIPTACCNSRIARGNFPVPLMSSIDHPSIAVPSAKMFQVSAHHHCVLTVSLSPSVVTVGVFFM